MTVSSRFRIDGPWYPQNNGKHVPRADLYGQSVRPMLKTKKESQGFYLYGMYSLPNSSRAITVLCMLLAPSAPTQ